MAVAEGRHGGRARDGVPAPTVSASLLLPQERIARAPLVSWASLLLARLACLRDEAQSPRDLARELSRVANNAALIAAHQGAGKAARTLCEAQILWHDRFSRRTGDPAIRAHAIQPWVNLGRLEMIAGEWERALERFALLGAQRSGGPIEIGCVRVAGDGWEAISPTPHEFGRFLENVCSIDSLKALLLNQRFAEVDEYVSAHEAEWSGQVTPFGREARIIAASRQGHFGRAVEMGGRAVHETSGWARAVFKLRLAETLAASGDAGAAVAPLGSLVEVVGKLSPSRRADLQNLYVIQRLAGACREMGMDGEARSLSRSVWEGARAAGDEVFEIESLRVLVDLAPAAERGRWREELDRLEETTLYRRYRRGGGMPPMHSLLERLYGELSEFLAN